MGPGEDTKTKKLIRNITGLKTKKATKLRPKSNNLFAIYTSFLTFIIENNA